MNLLLAHRRLFLLLLEALGVLRSSISRAEFKEIVLGIDVDPPIEPALFLDLALTQSGTRSFAVAAWIAPMHCGILS
jgi:hypothetical protein